MAKIVEFENVYIELPETYVKEEETKETVIDVESPTVEMIEETEEVVLEETTAEEVEETPVEETTEEPTEETVEEKKDDKPQIRIELPVQDKIVQNALRDIEEAEKKEQEKEEKVEDPAVTKQATTKLSFEELQKRLEETQALHL